MRYQIPVTVFKLAGFTRNVAWLALVAGAGLLLSGCKPGVETSTDSNPAGVYALVTVNGNPLPAAISHDGAALQIRSGTFILNADGTCSSKIIFVPPSGTEATREVTATYKREGSTLRLQWSGAGTTTGTVKGNTFTMDNEGMMLTYRK